MSNTAIPAPKTDDSCGASLSARCFNGEAGCRVHPVKRQFCRKGMHSAVPAITLIFSGNRRLHWCAEHASDAERYRPQAI